MSPLSPVLLLVLAPFAGQAPKTDPQAPLKLKEGLSAGDTFSTEIRYSNYWESLAIQTRGPASPPATPAEWAALVSSIEARPIAQDPLFVLLTLNVRLEGPGKFLLEPAVAEVKYFDGTGRKWAIAPGARDAEAQAGWHLKNLAIQWRREFGLSLEREMLEEQLLGIALVLLHKKSFAAVLEARNSDALFPDLEGFLSKNLPEEFPRPLWTHIEWFFRECLARAIAPQPKELKKGATFEAKGVPYRLESVKLQKSDLRVLMTGQIHRHQAGHSFKETVLFDGGTGVAIEGRSIAIRDAVNSRTARFGTVRFQTRLLDFREERKPRKDAGMGKP